MKKEQFTFKKHKKLTGLAAVGNGIPDVSIRINRDPKRFVGLIGAPNWQTVDHKWGISLMVKDENDNSGWRWVRFKGRWDTEEDARAFLTKHHDDIRSKYDLYEDEDYNID